MCGLSGCQKRMLGPGRELVGSNDFAVLLAVLARIEFL